MQQASSLTNLDGKPLLVLTADTGHDAKSAQEHLASLSTNSLHRVANATTTRRRGTKPRSTPNLTASA